MNGPEVMVVDTQMANLASMLAGLRRAGASPRLTCSAPEVLGAARLVLPGVGAFGAGMRRLRELGLVAPLVERVRRGKPLLAVCLGLQLLCAQSEESPGVAGLGVLPQTARRFPAHARGGRLLVPQLGWNQVEPEAGSRLLEPGYAYYANSYRLLQVPPGFVAALSNHGGPFVAALEREATLCCQFHPELSGSWGRELLRRWLAAADRWLAAKAGVAC